MTDLENKSLKEKIEIVRTQNIVLGDFLKKALETDSSHRYLNKLNEHENDVHTFHKKLLPNGGFCSALKEGDFGCAFKRADLKNGRIMYEMLNSYNRYAVVSTGESESMSVGFTERTVPAEKVEMLREQLNL